MNVLSKESENARRLINEYNRKISLYKDKGDLDKARYYREKCQGAYELYIFLLNGEIYDLPIEEAYKIESMFEKSMT